VGATKEDLALILQMEMAYRPSKEAKAFCWSAAVEGEDAGPRFWEKHGLDSDERMHVNAYATYFEMFALAWEKGLIDEELILDWVPAEIAWGRVGPVLIAARELLGHPGLWTGFEALAAAQAAIETNGGSDTGGALDGPVAAPVHHQVVFENDRVRILDTRIPAGETVPLHTHLTPHVMIIRSGSHFVRRDGSGGTMLDTRARDDFTMPKYLWSDGAPAHTLENTGTDDLELWSVELKDQNRG
jgi:hypothetical protein